MACATMAWKFTDAVNPDRHSRPHQQPRLTVGQADDCATPANIAPAISCQSDTARSSIYSVRATSANTGRPVR